MRSGPFSPAGCARAGPAARTKPSATNPDVRDFIVSPLKCCFCCERRLQRRGRRVNVGAKTEYKPDKREEFMSRCSIGFAAILGMLAISASGAWAQGKVFKFDNLSGI